MKDNVQKQSWKPFWGLMYRRVPWVWYLVNMVVSLNLANLTVKLPQLTGQLMAGEIFDSSIVLEYVVLTVINSLAYTILSFSMSWVDLYTDRRVQRDLWKKLVSIPMRDYDKQNPSVLISRVTNDTTTLSYVLFSVTLLISKTYNLFLIFKTIYGMSRKIAFSLILTIPYILLVMVIPGKILYRVNERKQSTLANFTNYVTERLMNIRLVKAAATESQEVQLGYAAAEANYKAEIKQAVVDACTQPFTYSTQGIVGAVILIMGGVMVNKGELTMENLITMFMYSTSIYYILINYIMTYHSVKEAHGATKVISDLMETRGEELGKEISFTQPDADLIFDHVTFSYDRQNVLSDVDLTIPRGKVTAIVGPSGAGKTTVLSLLERLYTPDSGSLRFGELPVEKIHLDEWRGAFGYIQQNSPLLSGTIRENITYGLDREATDAEVVRAAKLANAYDFIMKLPDGFDSDIGQLGGKLSGGERQRIAIARMIIKDPTYLLLDEATSSLDAENEKAVQDALNKLMKGRTAIVIAHNLRTVVNADNIIVMDRGRVQAVGTHNELYQNNALYRKYCDLQFAGQN